jgi:hypothetical protein
VALGKRRLGGKEETAAGLLEIGGEYHPGREVLDGQAHVVP